MALRRVSSNVRRWQASSAVRALRATPALTTATFRRTLALAAPSSAAATTASRLTLLAGAHAMPLQQRRALSTGAAAKVVVPPLGDSISSCQISAERLKKVGDSVKVDEVLALLETDKTVVDLPSPVGGVVTKAPAVGAEFKVGEVLFEIAAVAGGAAPAAAAKPAAPAAAPAAPAPAAPVASAAAAPAPGHAHNPRIQFRYGRANIAAAAAATTGGSHGAAPSKPAPAAPSAAAAKAGAKLSIPITTFVGSESLALNFSGPDPWQPTPEQYRRAPMSAAVMQLIELGGAVDPPAPAKAKAGGKAGAAAGGKKK